MRSERLPRSRQQFLFFFQLFDVKILAKFNKILEKSVEVTIFYKKNSRKFPISLSKNGEISPGKKTIGTHTNSNDIVVHSFLARDRNWTNLSAPVMFEKWLKNSNFQLRWQRYNPRFQPSSCPWSDFGRTIFVVGIIHNIAVLGTRTIISCEQSLWHCSADCLVANTLLHYLQSQQQELGQSEPASMTAQVSRSVHRMGCVFSSASSPYINQRSATVNFFAHWPLTLFSGPIFSQPWPSILPSHLVTLLYWPTS